MTPTQWLLSGDTGSSSKVICAVMTGSQIGDKHWSDNTPRDADDFGRCHRLLLHFPEWRARLQEVAAKFPCWTGLVREWANLEEMYRREADWKAMYELMGKLRDEGMRAAGWKQTGPGSWKHDAGARVISLGNGMSFSTGT